MTTDGPPGFFYLDDYLNEYQLNNVHDWFNSDEIQESMESVLGPDKPNGRKVIHYGYKYDYTNAGSTAVLSKDTSPFPDMIQSLSESARNFLVYNCPNEYPEIPIDYFNQCIINRYLPGEGIGAHKDSKFFEEPIVCYTFGSTRSMEFNKDRMKHEVITTPGSIYLMTGDARFEWTHQMRKRKNDIIDGKRTPRSTCFSITFRRVP